ncbi:MAG TPA: UDP-N-acetylmuramate dehydrogenase [Acidimicrobiales bacterium]|nr:UDP-N-acetylmuramate dehydrogenase [Acidimicrobiales bacterium]
MNAVDRALDEAAAILGDRAERDRPLGPLTTYRVGGPAALMVTAASEDDLLACRQAVLATGVAVLVVGKGSNLLVADAGFAGLAVLLGDALAAIEPDRSGVSAGAAAALPTVARRTAAAGLAGLEWAVGVPGSVGGGIRMNAGGHGSDVAACLERCRLVDLAGPEPVLEWSVAELGFGYRRSNVAAHQVVVEGRFRLEAGDRRHSESLIADIVRWRRANQPGGQNAGSVFTNPEGDSAGRLVDAAGLKGRRLGTALVSPKHANFIQADPGGSADDVRALMTLVATEVAARSGVHLVPEVRMIGFGEEESP